MSDAKFWWPITSPIDNYDGPPTLQSVEHQPITTRRGRVVYERKIHFFSENDLVRISSQTLNVTGKKYSQYWWLELMEKITIWMLDKILDKVFQGKETADLSERLYFIARNYLARIIDRLWEKDKKRLQEALSGGAH